MNIKVKVKNYATKEKLLHIQMQIVLHVLYGTLNLGGG